jgi:hypothetical protein
VSAIIPVNFEEYVSWDMVLCSVVEEVDTHFRRMYCLQRPPLWSSGQSFWVRFPALPDFLRSRGSGTVSTQPREDNWGATWKKSSGSGLENRDLRWWESVVLTTRHPLSQTLALTSPTRGSRSVGIVRSRTKATEFSFSLLPPSWAYSHEMLVNFYQTTSHHIS